MEYTVQKLSQLAGVTSRTLRHYDDIGLLKPKRINSSGYRIYGEEEVNKLQQILFFRRLSFSLGEIKEAIHNPTFDAEKVLLQHKQALLERKTEIDGLLHTIERTLADKRGETEMTDRDKFEGFKKSLLDENDKKYGEEVRKKYGKDTMEKTNKKFAGMSEEKFTVMQNYAAQIQARLTEAMKTGDVTGEVAMEVAEMHKRWLGYTWSSYSPEAHRGLAQMYVDDARFTAYYDDVSGTGAASFLRDAILHFTEQ